MCDNRTWSHSLFQNYNPSAIQNIPDIITVDTGDQNLSLMVVDEQSSNHGDCPSVLTCHDGPTPTQ